MAGLGPIYVKLISGFEELALLNVDAQELALSRGTSKDHPPRRIGGWKNLCTARMLIDNLAYKPLKHVHKVSAPTLLIGGVLDDITPIRHIRKAKELMGDRARLLEKPYGHIEMHRKSTLPEELAPTIDFLREHLLLKPTHMETHPHEQGRQLEEAAAAEVL